MFQNIDLTTFNLPDSVIQKIEEGMVKKQSEFISLKATLGAEITGKLIEGFKKISESLWQENETAFLQHGTTKEDVLFFSKYFMVQLFKNLFDRLIENSEEDIVVENV